MLSRRLQHVYHTHYILLCLLRAAVNNCFVQFVSLIYCVHKRITATCRPRFTVRAQFIDYSLYSTHTLFMHCNSNYRLNFVDIVLPLSVSVFFFFVNSPVTHLRLNLVHSYYYVFTQTRKIVHRILWLCRFLRTQTDSYVSVVKYHYD